MRALMLQAPEDLLAERRRKGLDLFDEVWDGLLHMVAPPSSWHQRFGTRLVRAIGPVAEALGLEAAYETGIYRHAKDYRTPDIVVARPEDFTELGASTAAVVFELLSPHDETYDKLDWYASMGVREVFVIEPSTRVVELFVLRGEKLHAVMPDERGVLRSAMLRVGFALAPGPKLALSGATDAAI